MLFNSLAFVLISLIVFLLSYSDIQESLLNGIICASGVPAGIKPSNSILLNTHGKFIGTGYVSVSTIPGSIVKGRSLWNGCVIKQEYPGGVFIAHGLFHFGYGASFLAGCNSPWLTGWKDIGLKDGDW